MIAHEVGHHVQNLLGTAEKVQAAQQRAGKAEANALSVRMELQADCFAGVWAKHAAQSRQLLEAGDVEEGLRAASAIGDDRLQQQTQGRVVPDAFTHGSSEQRVRWFRRGPRDRHAGGLRHVQRPRQLVGEIGDIPVLEGLSRSQGTCPCNVPYPLSGQLPA